MKIVSLILALLLTGCTAMAAEVPVPTKTDRELQLEKQLVDTELLLLQYQLKDLLDQQKKLQGEIDKRKPQEKK